MEAGRSFKTSQQGCQTMVWVLIKLLNAVSEISYYFPVLPAHVMNSSSQSLTTTQFIVFPCLTWTLYCINHKPTGVLYTRCLSLQTKQLRCGINHPPPPPLSAEVKERVEPFLFSPSGPSWSVLMWNYHFLYLFSLLCVYVFIMLVTNGDKWQNKLFEVVSS
jgi:hypothetical protein